MSEPLRDRHLEGRDGDDAGRHPPRAPTSTARRATASSSPGAGRRSSASPRTTRPSGATPRSPTSSSRTATRSCCRTCATATARRGRRSTSTARRRTRARTATTRSSGSPRSRGATAAPGWSAARTPASRRCAPRSRRPPHLTAIWPDVAPTNVYHHQTREGGAMQLHMFWALYIHAADAQDVQGDPDKQDEVWDDLRNLRQLFWELAVAQGRARAPPRPGARRDARELRARAAPTTSGGRRRRTTSRASGPTTPTSPRRCRPAGTTASRTRDTEYFAAMAEKNTSPQRLIVGPWTPRRHARRRDLHARRRLRRRRRAGACSTTSSEQLEYFDRWLPDDAAGQPADEAPVKIFVMGGGSGRRTEARQARPRRRAGATSEEWPLARAVPTTWHLHGDGSLRRRGAGGRRRSRGTSPTTPRIRCRRSAATTAPSASSRRRARESSRCGRACSTRRSGCGTS